MNLERKALERGNARESPSLRFQDIITTKIILTYY